MKQIIDEATGEIIEVETENELIEKKMFEVGAFDKETYEILDQYLYYQDQYELFKFKLKKAMEDNGIKKWDNDYFVASVREESLQKRVDTERLKADGVYDKYCKLVPVKSSLTIKFKKGNE